MDNISSTTRTKTAIRTKVVVGLVAGAVVAVAAAGIFLIKKQIRFKQPIVGQDHRIIPGYVPHGYVPPGYVPPGYKSVQKR